MKAIRSKIVITTQVSINDWLFPLKFLDAEKYAIILKQIKQEALLQTIKTAKELRIEDLNFEEVNLANLEGI